MKVEWSLHLSVPIVIWVINRFGLNRQKTVMVIIVSSVLYHWILISLYDHIGIGLLEILSRQFCGQLAYFYTGVLIYFYKYEFQAHLVKIFLRGLLFERLTLVCFCRLYPVWNYFYITGCGKYLSIGCVADKKHAKHIAA